MVSPGGCLKPLTVVSHLHQYPLAAFTSCCILLAALVGRHRYSWDFRWISKDIHQDNGDTTVIAADNATAQDRESRRQNDVHDRFLVHNSPLFTTVQDSMTWHSVYLTSIQVSQSEIRSGKTQQRSNDHA